MDRLAITMIRAAVLASALLSSGHAVARSLSAGDGQLGPRLIVEPAEAVLTGPRARQSLLVTQLEPRGSTSDVTAEAHYSSLNPDVARITSAGEVVPVSDGTATIKVVVGVQVGLAAVRVREARHDRPVSFTNEVIPILTRAGCNQGACHGLQAGKGGFKLSLAGYDPDADHAAITRQAKSRRLCRSDPEHSLFLLKPTLTVPHGGGRRLAPGSPEYGLLLRWIEEGAPGPRSADPRIVGLDVFPVDRVMTAGQRQRLVVRARFNDGSAYDVTAQTRLTSLNEGVAEVTPEGEARANGRGVTAIMARYMGLAAVSRITVPFASAPPAAAYPSTASFVDRAVTRKWQTLGLVPSGLCSDSEFIRRASLDAIGTLPSPEEVAAFLADHDPNKRARLIDALLVRPEYADYWSVKWGDLLRINRSALGEKGMWSFSSWLHRTLAENRPVDRWVRELITAQGSTFTTGPANFYRVASSPPDLAETTSQVFLGVRLQCARCHHHPFEKWSQNDYYALAAYFARVGLKGSDEFGIFGDEQVVRLSASGEVRQPRTKAVMAPRPLDGPVLDDPVDRRRALAGWLTSRRNHLFARNIVNRYWAYLLGRGIVEPVDDMRVTNPPTNPELLDSLADDFIAHGFDLKALLRTVMNSRVYQLSSEATPANRADELFYSHYHVKRMQAEVMLDAIDTATGTDEKFPSLPRGTRAIQLPDAGVESFFLDTFGRPPRSIACECERSAEPNIAQALSLMNGDLLNGKIGQKDGRVTRLLSGSEPVAGMIRELYLVTLARPPRPVEMAAARRLIFKAPHLKDGVEDLLWTLLNSREFLFIH